MAGDEERKEGEAAPAVVGLPQRPGGGRRKRKPRGKPELSEGARSVWQERAAKRRRARGEPDDDDVEAQAAAAAARGPRPPGKKRKVALIVAYNGGAYRGLQQQMNQPDIVTVEGTLVKACVAAGLVAESNSRELQKIQWTRCARTDKGVHAASNVIGAKLLIPETEDEDAEVARIPERLNAELPADIRALAACKVTKAFNAKNHCSSRLYSYVLPSCALASPLPADAAAAAGFRLPAARLEEFEALLQGFVGTKNYCNFTINEKFTSDSALRYITSVTVRALPAEDGAPEFVMLQIHGQSFLYNMIRKMVGWAVASARGLCSFDAAFEPVKTSVPLAPALGLWLQQPFFKTYDFKMDRLAGQKNQNQKAGTKMADLFAAAADAVEAFRVAQIQPSVSDAPSFLEWMRDNSLVEFKEPVAAKKEEPAAEAEAAEAKKEEAAAPAEAKAEADVAME